MKILVPIKRVPDYQVKVKVKGDGSGIETESVKWIVNPFDEIAVEEALKIKEAGKASEVVVVTIGPDEAQLRYAMAMGADSGILIKTAAYVDSDAASRILVEIFKRGEYGLIIMGKQAIDSDANQTPQLLSTRLGIPQGCFASKLEIEGNAATVTREVDGGLETIKIQMPCIVSTDLRLNQPRYASLPGIMKAKKKPLEELEVSTLGIDVNPRVAIKKMATPAKRQAGKKVESVDALISALQSEAKVL